MTTQAGAGSRVPGVWGVPEGSWVDVAAPEWYTALDLGERRALLERVPAPLVAPDDEADEIVEEWAARAAFADRGDFQARLAGQGLTEQRLREVVAQPPELLRDRLGDPPRWLLILAEAFTPEHVEAAEDIQPPGSLGEDRSGMLNLSRPIVARGIQRLRERIDDLRRPASAAGLDLEEAERLFIPSVCTQMLYHTQRCLALELHVFRLEERLRGDDSEQRYADFCRQLGDPEVSVPLLAEYSVLARRLVGLVEDWVEVTIELLERLTADWPVIRKRFELGEGVQRLEEAQSNAGDRHRGGRSVHLLRFSSGAGLVYKPRRMSADRHFQDFVGWMDGHLVSIDLQRARLMDRGRYGWMELLEHGSVDSRDGLARFYRRQGVYLALLYALHATDMHNENIMAAGEHPHVVDVEALLHPRVRRSQHHVLHDEPAREALDNSVYDIGLLPRRVWVSGAAGRGGLDLSALGGKGGQSSPDRLPMMVDIGTDQMRIVRDHLTMPETDNLPAMEDEGAAHSPGEFVGEVVAGFEEAYDVLLARRGELLGARGPLEAFREDELRQIVRPTRSYALRIMESTHPDHLRDAVDYDQFLDGLWVGPELDELMPDVFACEREDLLNSDVPLFSTRPGSADLHHHCGRVFSDFAQRPGLELARDKVANLSAEDRERQVWFIRASYTALSLGEDAATWPTFELRLTEDPVSADRLVEASVEVGDRLAALALTGERSASWLGLELVGESVWTLQAATPGFFSGIPGIALYLAQLGHVTGRDDYRQLAASAMSGAVTRWQDTRELMERVEPPRGLLAVGAFGQLSGVIYALCHLGRMWGESRWTEDAAELARLLPLGIPDDEELDVIGGTPSCIAVLRALHDVAPASEWMDAAVACGDHLLDRAVAANGGLGWPSQHSSRPLTGFSHGAAGNAWALVLLAGMCRAEGRDAERADRYEAAARDALAYERNVYSEERRNWPDFRELDGPGRSGTENDGAESFMTAWCHGAPGVGLSRVDISRYLDDPLLDGEIEVALETTLREGIGMNHSLCHGTLGNLQFPLALSRRRDDAHLRRHVGRLSGTVLDSIAELGWLTGVPHGVETPGLMTGLAGIGHGLLRLAAPEEVPSVLTLEPPIAR